MVRVIFTFADVTTAAQTSFHFKHERDLLVKGMVHKKIIILLQSLKSLDPENRRKGVNTWYNKTLKPFRLRD